MSQLLTTSNAGEQSIHELQGDLVTIGRHPDNAIVLDHESISTRHAELVQRDEHWIIHDLQSANGTTVNGAPVNEVELSDRDVICFGPMECIFQDLPEPNPIETPEPKERPESERVDPPASFGSKLARLGKAALNETKRNARLVALKAKIEKLKRIDLAKAHCALGKKAHELKVLRERFDAQFDQIEKLESLIERKRSGVPEQADATRAETFKRVAGNVAMKGEAEAQTLKLRRLMVELGQQIVSVGDHPPELATEIAMISRILRSIEEATVEYARLRDHAPIARVGFKSAFCFGTLLCALVVGGIALRRPPPLNSVNAPSSIRVPDSAEDSLPSEPTTEQTVQKVQSMRFQFGDEEKKQLEADYATYKEKTLSDVELEAAFSWSKEADRFLQHIDRFQTLTVVTSFTVLQHLGDGIFECRSDSIRKRGNFLLEAESDRFSSAGRAALPLRLVRNTTVTKTDGFEAAFPVYEVVEQEDWYALAKELQLIDRRLKKAVSLRVGSKGEWESLYDAVEARVFVGSAKRHEQGLMTYLLWKSSGPFTLRNLLMYESSQ
jgi:hypothetical protein